MKTAYQILDMGIFTPAQCQEADALDAELARLRRVERGVKSIAAILDLREHESVQHQKVVEWLNKILCDPPKQGEG